MEGVVHCHPCPSVLVGLGLLSGYLCFDEVHHELSLHLSRSNTACHLAGLNEMLQLLALCCRFCRCPSQLTDYCVCRLSNLSLAAYHNVLALDEEILGSTQQTEACILGQHVVAQVKVLAYDFPYFAGHGSNSSIWQPG
jgi:hypothetical protein